MPLIKDPEFTSKQNIEKDFSKNNPSLNSSKSEKGLVETIGSLLPYVPLVYEHFTGKKIPPMTGTLAEMNTSLSQLSLTLNQVINNQQQLWVKLENLEKGANQQFTHLGNQFQSLRLTHTRETKSIDYNKPKLEGEAWEEKN